METSSEEEIASQIIDLHDRVHLGFRKIAHRLLEEGSGKISKGTAWRLYKKHETPGPLQIQEDEELGKLKGKAERARRSFELFKQKNELRRNIAAFVVQRLMEDFGGRRRIFTEEKCLFRFAKRILRVTHPDLWTEFSEYCEMHGIDETLSEGLEESGGK